MCGAEEFVRSCWFCWLLLPAVLVRPYGVHSKGERTRSRGRLLPSHLCQMGVANCTRIFHYYNLWELLAIIIIVIIIWRIVICADAENQDYSEASFLLLINLQRVLLGECARTSSSDSLLTN